MVNTRYFLSIIAVISVISCDVDAPTKRPPTKAVNYTPSCKTLAVRDTKQIALAVDGDTADIGIGNDRVTIMLGVATEDNRTIGNAAPEVRGKFHVENVYTISPDDDIAEIVMMYFWKGQNLNSQWLCMLELKHADGSALSAKEQKQVDENNRVASK